MSRKSPPWWLERALVLLLNPRDRETISGDLLEEYREGKLPHLGSTRANWWYARQLLSFASVRMFGGSLVKQLLTLSCLFTIAAAVWLIVMEHVLKHPGYAGRSVIDACIIVQSVCALGAIVLTGASVLRKPVIVGAAAMILFGGSAIVRNLRADHFEGFVLIIGLALIVQGGLTIGLLFPSRHGVPPAGLNAIR